MESSIPERIVDRSRLDREDVELIRRLHAKHKTQEEIAQIVGCTQPTVSKWIKAILDPLEDAKNILRQGAPRLAERIVKNADVDESLEVLDRLDVAPKKERGSSGSNGVHIFVGMPNQPAGNDPFASVIALSPSNSQQLTE